MSPRTRKPLTRDKVLSKAIKLADAGGFESLSMRKLAKELGVEAMSLYNHVASKEDILDGIVDIVFSEIEFPSPGETDWKTAMRQRAISAREALGRHSWAVGLMENRNPGPANLRHHNDVMGCLREAGFSFRTAVHAYSVLDAYTYGFALQEHTLPFDNAEELSVVMERRRRKIPEMQEYPYLIEVATELEKDGYDYATEFGIGLEVILDGLKGLHDPKTRER
ncbi:MAG: TetR/AcrR family transcriptional regulator C-terminal domain-containing protein, partial [Thermoleophilaceae bacterium]